MANAPTNNFGFIPDGAPQMAAPAANDFGFVPDQQAIASSSQMSLPIRVGADALSGLAQMGHGLLNAPHNLVNMVSPSAAANIPTQQNYNFSQMLGINNPNIGDKIVQSVAQYSPYLLGGEAALAGKAAPGMAARLGVAATAGGTFGATQSQNPAIGAPLGALTNLAGAGLSEAINPLWSGVKSYLSKYAAQGLTKNLGSMLEDAKNTTNQQAFNLAKNNFDNYTQQEGSAWNDLSNTASQVDAQGVPFDNSSYVQALKNRAGNLANQSSRQSGYSRANSDSINLLNDYANDQHGTFTDAIEHNKALNQDYQNEITPGKSLPFSTVNFAKGNIKNAINSNITNNDLATSLGQAWQSANAITSQKNQIFNQVVNPSGIEKRSTFATLLNGKNPNADPTTFVNDYLPTAKGDGIQKMQQFSQMLGDDNQAKNILKQNYFDKALTSDGADPKAFLNKYNNLSQDQQNFLFQPQENQQIQALNKIAEAHPDILSKSSFTGFWHHSVPAIIGGTAGHFLGAGAYEGMLGGYLGGMGATAALSKAFENPAISNYFVNALTAPKGAGTTIAPMLGRYLAPLITPNAINSMGNQ